MKNNMKHKIATTVEQSIKLVELGIDPSTADMFYSYELRFGKISNNQIEEDGFVRAWSLSALIGILPSELELPDMYGKTIKYEIRIRKYRHANELDLYQIAYATNQGLSKSWHDMVNTSEQEDLLDAVFEMVCYLKENEMI